MASLLRLQRPVPSQSPMSPRLRLGPSCPRLSIVVVNFCQWDNTVRLVRQIRAARPTRAGEIEIVIVDNHSPPHRLMRWLRRCPEVSLRRWGRNRGFARAVNEGCRLSRGDWVLLLNPDVVVSTEFVNGVLKIADDLQTSDPKAGIIGFQLANSDGSRQLSWGGFPSLMTTLTHLVLPRHQRKYSTRALRDRAEVPWVTGCCLLVRNTCLDDLAGLDERFFLYYEDVDLCCRARAKGWKVFFDPSLQAVHCNPIHQRSVPAVLRLITRHSLLTYGQQHWSRWQFLLLTGIVQIEARARKLWAEICNNGRSSEIFNELAVLAVEVRRGDAKAARKRLHRVVREQRETLANASGEAAGSGGDLPANILPLPLPAAS